MPTAADYAAMARRRGYKPPSAPAPKKTGTPKPSAPQDRRGGTPTWQGHRNVANQGLEAKTNQYLANLNATAGVAGAVGGATNQIMADTFAGMSPAPAGGGGRRGGGGGGGGGVPASSKAAFDAYAAQVLATINAMPRGQAQVNPLTAMVNPAVDRDVAAARGEFSNLDGALRQLYAANPYANMQAQPQAAATPELAQFLSGQGAGGAEYDQAVSAAQGEQAAMNQNWQGLQRALGANFNAAGVDARANAGQQGAAIVSGLEGQRSQLQALAAVQQAQLDREFQAQQMQQRQQQIQMLMELLGTGLQFEQTPDISAVLAQIGAPR